jgi:signal transduction histidine kinase
MTIKRRLRYSYLLMLIIPVLLILISGVSIQRIYDPVQEYAELPPAFYRELYTTMANDPDRLLSEEYLRELERLSGYAGRINMYVSRDRRELGRIQSIDIPPERNRLAPSIVFTDWDFYFSDGSAGEFSFFVSDESKFAASYISLGLVLMTAVTVLILANGLISWHMGRSIIGPLYLLEGAARTITGEDLDTALTYEGDDEFLSVVNAFEDMRLRLKQSLAAQRNYEENRKALLANISHDLKTPITAITGYIAGIRDGIADSPEKLEHYLATIQRKSDVMNNLIDNLFLLSRLDVDSIPFHFRTISLPGFLADSCDELRQDYPDMTLIFQPPEIDIHVQADGMQLRRVIANIISNADKHKRGDASRIDMTCRESGEYAEIQIRDDGPGIDDEAIAMIFDRFYRADSARSSRTEGSGLGLSIAKKIIEAHGGTIAAANAPGGGLEIRFTLRRTDEKDTDH